MNVKAHANAQQGAASSRLVSSIPHRCLVSIQQDPPFIRHTTKSLKMSHLFSYRELAARRDPPVISRLTFPCSHPLTRKLPLSALTFSNSARRGLILTCSREQLFIRNLPPHGELGTSDSTCRSTMRPSPSRITWYSLLA